MRTLRRALVLGLLATAVAAVPAGAANETTFSDSAGEPVKGDITTVVVSNDDAGMISFRINVPALPQYTRDVAAELYVDSDLNAATGSQDIPGIDYVIQLFNGEVNLFKWDGADFTRTFGNPPATTLIYQWANGVTIKISAAELGNTKALRFLADVITGIVFDPVTGDPDFAPSTVDFAPDLGKGFYQYEVKIAPAKLVLKSLSTTPAQPKAGKTYTVRMSATRSDTGATISAGTVTCTAKVGTKALKATSAKFVGGQAVCVFKVPSNAKGQTLRGTITITFEGKKLARPFAGKVS